MRKGLWKNRSSAVGTRGFYRILRLFYHPGGPAPQVLPKLCTGLVSARGSFLKASAVASALGVMAAAPVAALTAGAMVNLYAMGVGAEKFGGVYDNTEVFHKLAELTSVQ